MGAKGKKYPKQFAVVATQTQYDLIKAVSEQMPEDKAPIARAGVDLLFGLHDGELREGDTMEAAVERATARVVASLSGNPVESETSII